MIGRLFNRNNQDRVRLNQKKIQQFQEAVGDLSDQADRCEAILKTALEERINIKYIGRLQFELAPSDHSEKTNAETLKQDSIYFSKFRLANSLVCKSAKNLVDTLEDEAWHLRDHSHLLEVHIKKNIVNFISEILKGFDIKPPHEPQFPKLEQVLNDDTERWLSNLPPTGDQTDDSKKTLLYLARDYVIIREFKDMLHSFLEQIGKMRK